MTDPIADMLTRIRNANQMRNKEVSMPVSKMKLEIAKILDAEGFITNYTVKESDRYDQLSKIKKLLNDGVLTQEEFEKEKRKILQ